MKVLKFVGDKFPDFVEIEESLEEYQCIVNGYIEVYYLTDEFIVVCNEEGKINGLPINWMIGDEKIAGDFFICRNCGCDFTSLKESDIDFIFNNVVRVECDPLFDPLSIGIL